MQTAVVCICSCSGHVITKIRVCLNFVGEIKLNKSQSWLFAEDINTNNSNPAELDEGQLSLKFSSQSKEVTANVYLQRPPVVSCQFDHYPNFLFAARLA